MAQRRAVAGVKLVPAAAKIDHMNILPRSCKVCVAQLASLYSAINVNYSRR